MDPSQFSPDNLRREAVKLALNGYSLDEVEALSFDAIDEALDEINPALSDRERAAIMGYAGAAGIYARRKRVKAIINSSGLTYGVLITMASTVKVGQAVTIETMVNLFKNHLKNALPEELVTAYLKIGVHYGYFAQKGENEFTRAPKALDYQFQNVESRALHILLGKMRHHPIRVRLPQAGFDYLRNQLESDKGWPVKAELEKLDEETALRLAKTGEGLPSHDSVSLEDLPNYGVLAVLRPAAVANELSRSTKVAAGEAILQYSMRNDIVLRPTSATLDTISVPVFESFLKAFAEKLDKSAEKASRLKGGDLVSYQLSLFYGHIE